MRGFVFITLDIVAYLVLIAATAFGTLAGMAIAANPQIAIPEKGLAPVFGMAGGFIFGVLIAGGVLVLTEIARNSRRTVELLQRAQDR